MAKLLGKLNVLKAWQWLTLVAVFAGAAGGAYVVHTTINAADGGGLGENQSLVPVTRDEPDHLHLGQRKRRVSQQGVAELRYPGRAGQPDGGGGSSGCRRAAVGFAGQGQHRITGEGRGQSQAGRRHRRGSPGHADQPPPHRAIWTRCSLTSRRRR